MAYRRDNGNGNTKRQYKALGGQVIWTYKQFCEQRDRLNGTYKYFDWNKFVDNLEADIPAERVVAYRTLTRRFAEEYRIREEQLRIEIFEKLLITEELDKIER